MLHRSLLVVSVLALGIGLFLLPRQVLNNDQKANDKLANRDQGREKELPLEDDKEAKSHQDPLSREDSLMAGELLATYQASTDDGQKEQALDSLVAVYTGKAKYSQAARFAEEKAKLSPDHGTWKKTGSLYVEAASFAVDEEKRKGYLDRAQHYLNKALDAEPSDLDLKVGLAETYVMGENPMEGIFMLREVLQQDPKHQKALYQMGLLSIQSGQWDKAVERLETYTGYYPADPQGWFYLGLSYKNLQMNKKARESFRQVLKLDQDPEVAATVETYLNDLNDQ